jgi:hypothetical protein
MTSLLLLMSILTMMPTGSLAGSLPLECLLMYIFPHPLFSDLFSSSQTLHTSIFFPQLSTLIETIVIHFRFFACCILSVSWLRTFYCLN